MIRSYLSSKTTVRKNSTHGRGLFAARPIKKGEIVAIKGGHLINGKTLEKFENIIGDSELQIADNFYLAPLKRSEIRKVMMFLNHSCEPNVGVAGNIVFVAMRNIKPGEELTIDYAVIDNSIYRMKCNCGARSCRRVITGKDWKQKNLQKKYGNYFSHYLRRKM